MRHTTPLLVALCVLAPAVVAQDTLKIYPGERVRLTLESGRSTVGVLVTQDRDSLRIRPRPDAPPAAFSRSRIAGVEASLGRHGHAGTGALVGLVAGGAAGAALGGAARETSFAPARAAAPYCSAEPASCSAPSSASSSAASGGSKSTKTQSRSASRRPEGDSA